MYEAFLLHEKGQSGTIEFTTLNFLRNLRMGPIG